MSKMSLKKMTEKESPNFGGKKTLEEKETYGRKKSSLTRLDYKGCCRKIENLYKTLYSHDVIFKEDGNLILDIAEGKVKNAKNRRDYDIDEASLQDDIKRFAARLRRKNRKRLG